MFNIFYNSMAGFWFGRLFKEAECSDFGWEIIRTHIHVTSMIISRCMDFFHNECSGLGVVVWVNRNSKIVRIC